MLIEAVFLKQVVRFSCAAKVPYLLLVGESRRRNRQLSGQASDQPEAPTRLRCRPSRWKFRSCDVFEVMLYLSRES